MAVYKQPKSKNWWYKFVWNGQPVRESTKQTNKRVAEQMEAAHRTALAKGEVGIRDRKPVPTLAAFADRHFRPFVEAQFKDKPKTLEYYLNGVKNLLSNAGLAATRVDAINSEKIGNYIGRRRDAGLKVSSINRELEVLRRMLKLAQDWEMVEKPLQRVSMLPGENERERVLSVEEETGYLTAANDLGQKIEEDYQKALSGIRATKRSQQPHRPDPFLLRDVTSILLDCGLRPEECFRLRWSDISDGSINISHGKTENARRVIPMTPRVSAMLEMRRTSAANEWLFPATTRTGHIEKSSPRKLHQKACMAAGIQPFLLYTLRHTCLTRWAAHMDPYTLAYLAGHSDFSTAKRYVHPQAHTVRAAMERVRNASSGHTSGHTGENEAETKNPPVTQKSTDVIEQDGEISGRIGRGEWIRTTDLLVPNQAL
jgi:integrase